MGTVFWNEVEEQALVNDISTDPHFSIVEESFDTPNHIESLFYDGAVGVYSDYGPVKSQKCSKNTIYPSLEELGKQPISQASDIDQSILEWNQTAPFVLPKSYFPPSKDMDKRSAKMLHKRLRSSELCTSRSSSPDCNDFDPSITLETAQGNRNWVRELNFKVKSHIRETKTRKPRKDKRQNTNEKKFETSARTLNTLWKNKEKNYSHVNYNQLWLNYYVQWNSEHWDDISMNSKEVLCRHFPGIFMPIPHTFQTL